MHSLWLYITSFLDLFATSLLVPFLVVHLYALGLSRLSTALITCIYPTIQLFSSPAAGYCSDCCGRKRTLVFSLLSCSFAYYLLASTSSPVLIIVCRIVLGVVKHTQTLCKAVFVELSKEESLSKQFGIMNAVEAMGFMLGPVVGAHFIETQNGFQDLCKITTTLFVINAVIVFYFLPEENNYSKSGTSSKSDIEVQEVCEKINTIEWNVFWDIFMLKWCLCISLSLFYTNYAILVVEQFEVSPSMIGYTNSFQGLVSVLTGLISSNLTSICYLNKSNYIKLFHCFLILSCSLFFIGFVSDFFTFVICLVPLSSSSTLLRIYTTEILVERSNLHNRASLIGAENTIASSAFLLSPFIFEWSSANFGSSSISLVTSVVAVIGASISAVLGSSSAVKSLRRTDVNFNCII